MTKQQIDELRELERAATLGPWNVTTRSSGNVLSDREITALPGFYPILIATTARGQRGIPDAEFITAARNALPELLDALETAERKLKIIETVMAVNPGSCFGCKHGGSSDECGRKDCGTTAHYWEFDYDRFGGETT